MTCKEGEVAPNNDNVLCIPLAIVHTDLTKGSTYSIHRDTYHTITPLAPTITKIVREEPVKEFAQIIRPIGKERLCPFSQKVPESELWELVNRYA